MAFATYQDLWLEAGDPDQVAAFWARALGAERRSWGSGYRLTDQATGHTIYVMPSTPGTLQGFRLHVDLCEADLEQLRSLAAFPVTGDETEPWLELSGPEDSHLRCFPTGEPHDERRYELVLAAARPTRAARWWARALGAVDESAAGGDYAWIAQVPDAPFETLMFTSAGGLPEHRRARMRLATSDMPGLIRYGAAMVTGTPQTTAGLATDDRGPTYVMRCPEGVEFLMVDVSGSPELARTSRPPRPVTGPR